MLVGAVGMMAVAWWLLRGASVRAEGYAKGACDEGEAEAAAETGRSAKRARKAAAVAPAGGRRGRKHPAPEREPALPPAKQAPPPARAVLAPRDDDLDDELLAPRRLGRIRPAGWDE